MITSLELKNWRTHSDTKLDFGKGTNVIVGVMGSGKSSIVNAISYSLFGTFPGLKNKSVSLKEIIMNKPNQMSTAEAAIEIEQNETKHRVERIVKMDGTNEAKLYTNGKFVAGPKQKDVNEKVEKILEMDYELFSRAVYSEQNEMDFFLKLTPGERKRKFDELLQLEKYEEARKNSVSLQNELMKESKQREKTLEQQKEMLKNHEEEKLTKQIKEIEEEIKETLIKAEQAKKENRELEKKYKELAEKEEKARTLEDKITKTKSKIEMLQEELKKTEKLDAKDIMETIEKLKKEIKTQKENEKEIETKAKEVDTKIKTISEEVKVLSYKIKKYEEEIKEISSLKGKCPTCRQEMDETHKEKIVEETHGQMQKSLAEKKEHETNKSKLLDKFSSLEKTLRDIRKNIEEKQKEIYITEEKEKKSKDLEEKRKMLGELNEVLPLMEKQSKENGFDKKELNKIRELFFEKKKETELFEAKAKAKTELKKSYETILAKVEQIKKTIQETEKETIKYSESSRKMSVFASCLIATQGELREEMLQTINKAMTNIWQAIYPYADFVDAKLCVTEEGYDLQVLTRTNQWTRVEGILSGGERSAAALCIRMAFALVLTKNLSMLILDEPTHNLDANAVQKLSSMLREEMPKLVEQIFVITHDKELESAASSNLYLLQRNKNNDEATKIETMPIM